MKKLFLFILFSSMGLSLYPAKVTIENKTDELVFARVNNQNRTGYFYSDMKRVKTGAGLAALSMGISEGGAALSKETSGSPNFVPIKPNSSKTLATTRFVSGVKGGDFGGAKGLGSGAKIYKITFLRIKEVKTVQGTYTDLKSKINSLNNVGLYLIKMSEDNKGGIHTFYVNPFDEKREKLTAPNTPSLFKKLEQSIEKGREKLTFGSKHAVASVKIPIIEQFTYELKGNEIRRHESGKVVLEKWGDAKRVK